MGGILDDWFGIEKPKLPKVPSADEVAAKQAQAQLDAQRANIAANRVDQTTPYASISWAPTGTDQFGNTTYGATTQLSPENQALLDQLFQNKGASGQAASNLLQSILGSSAYGINGLPDLSSAIEPMMERQLQYLDPYFQHQQEIRLNELRNRGLEAGNPAFDYEMMNLMQQQDRSVGDYLNKFTDTAMNLWKLPIGGVQALMGMSGPVMGNAGDFGFSTVPTANQNPVDFAAIQNQTNQALMEQYKAQMADYNSTIQAIGQGAGMVLGAPGGTLLGGINQAAAGGLAGMLGLNAPTGGTRTTTSPSGATTTQNTGFFF